MEEESAFDVLYENFDHITKSLSYREIVALCETNATYQSYCQDPRFWRRRGLERFGYDLNQLRGARLNGIQGAYAFVELILVEYSQKRQRQPKVFLQILKTFESIGIENPDLNIMSIVLSNLANLNSPDDARKIIVEYYRAVTILPTITAPGQQAVRNNTPNYSTLIAQEIVPNLYYLLSPNNEWSSVREFSFHQMAGLLPFFFTNYFALYGPGWMNANKALLPAQLTKVLLEFAPVSDRAIVETLLQRKLYKQFLYLANSMLSFLVGRSAGQQQDLLTQDEVYALGYQAMNADGRLDLLIELYHSSIEMTGADLTDFVSAMGPNNIDLDLLDDLLNDEPHGRLEAVTDLIELSEENQWLDTPLYARLNEWLL
jgi:hypothetical protein